MNKAINNSEKQQFLDYFAILSAQTEADLLQISDRIFRTTNSQNRLPVLLDEVKGLRYDLGYKLFKDIWSSCDDTDGYRPEITEFFIECFDVQEPPVVGLGEEAWFGHLPERFRIYRGCDISRIGGMSWTTDKEIALSFALGHRQFKNPDPVVVSAYVRKDHVWMATNDRNELEVLVSLESIRDPRFACYTNSCGKLSKVK